MTMARVRSTNYFIIVIFSLISFGLTFHVEGQYYTLGTDPASVKWKLIKTPHYKLIYPVTFERRAQYIANGLEYIYSPEGRTLNSHAPKTPLILHNQTTNPNAVTPYAPKRVEFFTVPPQDVYTQDWIDQLILHEFRHVNQYAAVNQGFTKAMYYLFGEQAVPAMIGIFVPFWFIEGDATVAETALSDAGRGRVPSFEMRIMAQFLQKGIYSYDKAVNGSFRDFIPDRYELGYQLVGMTREMYGASVWGGVLKKVGCYPFMLVPFSYSLKKQTGHWKYGLYKVLTRKLMDDWRAQDNNVGWKDNRVISKPTGKWYTNYNLPVIYRDSLVIAERSSIDDLTRIVRISGNKTEKKLFLTGIGYQSESLTVSDSILYWSEKTNDPRWSLRDYRVIKSYNLNSGKIRQLTHCTRYFAPSVTRDGKLLVIVGITLDNKYSLDILNSADGTLIKKITTPENLLFIQPSWADDGLSIVTVLMGREGNTIGIVDPGSSRIDILLPYTMYIIKDPSFYKNYVIFTASFTGIDNIYAVDRKTHVVYKVTSSRFGASDASTTVGRDGIVFSDYTADGSQLAEEIPDTASWKRFVLPEVSPFPMASILSKQENFIFNSDSVPKTEYPVKKYRKGLNLFNFHSWAPLSVDAQNVSASPGVTFLSQNLLSSSFTKIGYSYDLNQETGKYYLTYTYEGLYPAIDLNADYGLRRSVYMDKKDTIPFKWNELNLSATVRLPLFWTHNAWYQGFQPSVGSTYKYLKMDKSSPLQFIHDRISTMEYSVYAYNQFKTSYRDLYPRWGQFIQFNFNNTPFGSGYNSILAGQAIFYFPGILKHHGLRLYGGYQKRTVDYYIFSDIITYPRGYTGINLDQSASLSATYAFPLFYPDWRIGPVIYIKRFKTAAFYDYAWGLDQAPYSHYSSTGLDLTMDFNVLSFIAPFEAGLRTMYLPESGSFQFQFLFSIDINSIY
jgi:hypothetical protein